MYSIAYFGSLNLTERVLGVAGLRSNRPNLIRTMPAKGSCELIWPIMLYLLPLFIGGANAVNLQRSPLPYLLRNAVRSNAMPFLVVPEFMYPVC